MKFSRLVTKSILHGIFKFAIFTKVLRHKSILHVSEEMKNDLGPSRGCKGDDSIGIASKALEFETNH